MDSFDQLLAFVDLLHQLRTVERSVLIKNSDRNENDTEHSFSLAMIGWYVNATHKLGFDMGKICMYALAHDVVEVYAGDTYFYSANPDQDLKNKIERERQAALRLQKEFPEFPELHTAIENYEKRVDKESAFIYALDKIEPVLSIYRDKGRTWKKDGITLEMLETMKAPKVAVDPTVTLLFKELVARLKVEHKELFTNPV